MIDGSPQFLHQSSKTNLKDASDEKIGTAIIHRCIQILFPNDFVEISKKVFGENTYEARLKMFLKLETERLKYSASYSRKMIGALIRRIKISVNADKLDLPTLGSTLIALVKPKIPYSFPLDDDYGLKKYSGQAIKVTHMEGNHATILKNLELIETLKN